MMSPNRYDRLRRLIAATTREGRRDDHGQSDSEPIASRQDESIVPSSSTTHPRRPGAVAA